MVLCEYRTRSALTNFYNIDQHIFFISFQFIISLYFVWKGNHKVGEMKNTIHDSNLKFCLNIKHSKKKTVTKKSCARPTLREKVFDIQIEILIPYTLTMNKMLDRNFNKTCFVNSVYCIFHFKRSVNIHFHTNPLLITYHSSRMN